MKKRKKLICLCIDIASESSYTLITGYQKVAQHYHK